MPKNIGVDAEIERIRLMEQTSVPTPDTGYGYLYAKSDGLYFKGDNGTEIGPFIELDADAIHRAVSNEFNSLTEKAIPVLNDRIIIEDSEAGYAKKWANLDSVIYSGGDAVYLKLDTSNGPLTNGLAVVADADSPLNGLLSVTQTDSGNNSTGYYAEILAGHGAFFAIKGYVTGLGIQKSFDENGATTNPVIQVDRFNGTASSAVVDGPILIVEDSSTGLGFSGNAGTVRHKVDGGVVVDINPYAAVDGTAIILDTVNNVTASGELISLRNQGSTKFEVDGTGNVNIPAGKTYNINGVPHTHTFSGGGGIEEAPIDGFPYSRQDGGWIVASGSGTPTVTRVFTFATEGDLTTQAGAIRIYNKFGHSLTITKVFSAVNTAPTGASILVDVNKDGTTIFTTQSNRPAIVASANTGESTTIEVSTWEDGKYLTMDIDQIGSTISGSNLSVQVYTEE